MKSAMETSILLTAPSLRTSWWRKVWQFISYDWPRPSVLPLFTPLPLPFESRVERETAKEFTGENMQCYLSGGGTVAVVPLLWLHCYSNPLLMTWMLSDWFQTSQAFTLPCNLLGEQLLVTPEVDGGNIGSAGLDVLSSLDMQNMKKRPGGIEAIWKAFIAVQAWLHANSNKTNNIQSDHQYISEEQNVHQYQWTLTRPTSYTMNSRSINVTVKRKFF